MESPIRPRVYVEKERVWAPPTWRENRVILRGGTGEIDKQETGTDITDEIQFGEMNDVPGAPDTAYIEEASPLRLKDLQAQPMGSDRLAVQVGLSGEASQQPVGIVLTLTSADGHEIGHSEVLLGKSARSITVEMKVPPRTSGQTRLKATLYVGERVVDNGRTVIEV